MPPIEMEFKLSIDGKPTVWRDPLKMESYIRDRLGLWFDRAEKEGQGKDETARAQAADSAVNLLKQGQTVVVHGHYVSVSYAFATPKP